MTNTIQSKKKKTRLVIVSKTRFVTASVLTLILLSMLFSYVSGTITSASSIEKFETITVTYGDTLWDIAVRYNEEGTDIRETLYHIKQANQLRETTIYPGQILQIPLKNTPRP